MEERKRKCDFGSSEKERKHYKENSCMQKRQIYDNGNRRREDSFSEIKKEKNGYAEFLPKSASSAQKSSNRSFGTRIENPKSRRRIPLDDVQNKKISRHSKKAVAVPVETDERKLATRQRQIDIGKNTEGYARYLQDVARLDRTSDHPWTPNKFTVCSTRSWQGVMRIWRRKLHFWDSPETKETPKETFFDGSVNTIETAHKSTKQRIDNSMDIDDCPSSGSSQSSTSDEVKTSLDWYNSDEDDLVFSRASAEGDHLFQQLLDSM